MCTFHGNRDSTCAERARAQLSVTFAPRRNSISNGRAKDKASQWGSVTQASERTPWRRASGLHRHAQERRVGASRLGCHWVALVFVRIDQTCNPNDKCQVNNNRKLTRVGRAHLWAARWLARLPVIMLAKADLSALGEQIGLARCGASATLPLKAARIQMSTHEGFNNKSRAGA